MSKCRQDTQTRQVQQQEQKKIGSRKKTWKEEKKGKWSEAKTNMKSGSRKSCDRLGKRNGAWLFVISLIVASAAIMFFLSRNFSLLSLALFIIVIYPSLLPGSIDGNNYTGHPECWPKRNSKELGTHARGTVAQKKHHGN